MDRNTNPYAVTAQADLAAPLIQHHSRGIIDWVAWLSIPLLCVGCLLAIIDIETIVGSGPVMFVIGIVLLPWSILRTHEGFKWFWSACVVFPIAVFLIIALGELSPQQAQWPIGALICLFSAACILGLIMSIQSRAKLLSSQAVSDLLAELKSQ